MPLNINYDFLSNLEGGCKISGYGPATENSKSGVTIATGFDLGQRNENDLDSLKIDATLMVKLKPYLGLKGQTAQDLLIKSPLKISLVEAKSIDKKVKSTLISQIISRYNNAEKNNNFINLPPQAQTVIASVSFQYGSNLQIRAPKFWKAVTSQNWEDTIKILKSFHDIYPTRRKKEAALMETIR